MSVAAVDIALGMHDVCCPAEGAHAGEQRAACAQLWETTARDFAAAPSYARAVERFHELTCEADHARPGAVMSFAEHVSWLGSRYELRAWWVRAGHEDPAAAVTR